MCAHCGGQYHMHSMCDSLALLLVLLLLTQVWPQSYRYKKDSNRGGECENENKWKSDESSK